MNEIPFPPSRESVFKPLEYNIALSMANESARIRLSLVLGTDNVWHMRLYPSDAFLTEFDLDELRTVLNQILSKGSNNHLSDDDIDNCSMCGEPMPTGNHPECLAVMAEHSMQ